MNTVLETVCARSSIRAYTPEKLTEEELSALRKAALASPTAMNRQDQRFIYITSDEKRARLEEAIIEGVVASGNTAFLERMKSRGGKVTYDAPLVVVICAKPGRFSPVDAGIAVENLALAAKSMGLDSVILGMPAAAFSGPNAEAAKAEFAFPEGFEFEIAISIGHRAMDKAPHEYDGSHVIDL
jgi:nitroreductase